MNMRDLIKQLRYTAEVLEQLVGDSVMQEREWKQEQSKGKSHIIFDETFDKFPTRDEFMEKWTTHGKRAIGNMKRKPYVHWTQLPENKEKLARTVKKMIAGKKAKNGKK